MFKLILLTCVGFWTCDYHKVEIGTYRTMQECQAHAKELQGEGVNGHVICEESL